MEITLNHTIIYSKNKINAAKWYCDIFNFEFLKEWGIFAIVRVNSHLTIDFKDSQADIQSQHYAFKVNDKQFDQIFDKLIQHKVKYCSSPFMFNDDKFDYKINHEFGGRGVYFLDPNGHKLEIITKDYEINEEFPT